MSKPGVWWVNGQILLTVEKKYELTEQKVTDDNWSNANVEYINSIQPKSSVTLSSFNFVFFLAMLSLVVFFKKRLTRNELIKIF